MCYANDLFLSKNNFKIKCVFDAISVLGFIFFKKEKFIPKKGRKHDEKHFLTIYTEGGVGYQLLVDWLSFIGYWFPSTNNQ